MSRFRLLVVGVGGQGVLTGARLVGEAALRAGQDAVVGQLHGMSQRGGSVESTVLVGPGLSTFIGPGQADVVVGLEPIETLRAASRMSARTVVLVNRGRVVPFTLAQQGKPYPELDGVLARIRQHARRVIELDGPALVEASGSSRALNIAMLGALASTGVLPFDGAVLWDVVAEHGRRNLDASRRAFDLGGKAVA